MTGLQFEELCRFAIADQLKVPVADIESAVLPNPRKNDWPGVYYDRIMPYTHQIDLFWLTRHLLACYINIAEIKWKNGGYVSQAEVLKLQQVRMKVRAHKAVLLTNASICRGALYAAMDDEIALLQVIPGFEPNALGTENQRAAIQTFLSERGAGGQEVYALNVIRKGLGADLFVPQLLGQSSEQTAAPIAPVPYPTRGLAPSSAPIRPTAPPGGSSGSGSGSRRGEGAYQTRQGPGRGFRMK